MIHRRTLLQSALASAAFTPFLASLNARAESSRAKVPIALQVYSVRAAAEKDLAGTLQKIAAIGYKGVEFAGTYGHSAESVKAMLDAAGLVCIGTHLSVEALLGETFDETVAYNKTIGNPNLVVAGGLSKAIASDAGNRFTAYLFSELAQKAKKVDCRVGFHAHGGDFTDIDGQTAWNLFFERTDPEVIAEMDIGNTLACGADPYEAMERFPGRGKLIHLKACGEQGPIIGGEGDRVDWKRAFEICESTAGTEWYIVEQEGGASGADPMDAAAGCMENLKKMGKA